MVACSSPSRVALGELEVVSAVDRPIAFSAVWRDEQTGYFGALEGVLPEPGDDVAFAQGPVPAGAVFRFADRGAGFDALVAEHAVEVQKTTLSLFGGAQVEYRMRASASVSRSEGSAPQETIDLSASGIEWLYPGGAARLRIEDDDAGGIRLSERPPRR
jgi:hypothetical protein